jgi:hypothetical protein
MDLLLILIQLGIIAIYIWRFPIIDRLPEPGKSRYLPLAADTRFSIGTWWKTILVPVLVIILSYLVWVYCLLRLFHQFPALTFDDPVLVHFIESCILAPLSEEILQCLFLSAAFLAIIRMYRNRWIIAFMLFSALLLISFIIANSHVNPASVNWLLRFNQFLIYGGLYYLNDRNLLPAFVAHATWNTVIMGAGLVMSG